MPNKIRVRFAPSPTGFVHVGSLRTALYNYLFAKHHEGDFVLRVEDTDRERYVDGAIENLLETLTKMNLGWDEGPIDKNNDKGDYGPYLQSQRLKIYKKYIEELINNEKAYYCFCSSERLKEAREEQQKKKRPSMYDGKCRNLSPEEINKKLSKKTPRVVRLKVPREGETHFKDIIRGEVSFKNELIDDQILLKSDGFPTYHLANVVDDYLMGITHVIRGEEWLPSTPKHILLYQSFGWYPPQFAHLPLLLNIDKSKLSKRQGDVGVEDYLKKGYLPEALLNFVAFLGWNPGGDQEIYSLNDLIKKFDLKNVNKSGAVFNLKKLDWLNGYYIRKMDLKILTNICKPYLPSGFEEKYYQKVVGLEQERLKRIIDIKEGTDFFFSEKLDYDPPFLIWKKSTEQKTKENLKKLLRFLEGGTLKWGREELEKTIIEWIKTNNLTNGEILWPFRVALTGQKNSPPPFEVAEILGPKKTLKRLREGIDKLD